MTIISRLLAQWYRLCLKVRRLGIRVDKESILIILNVLVLDPMTTLFPAFDDPSLPDNRELVGSEYGAVVSQCRNAAVLI